jgi:hypothetical protein
VNGDRGQGPPGTGSFRLGASPFEKRALIPADRTYSFLEPLDALVRRDPAVPLPVDADEDVTLR